MSWTTFANLGVGPGTTSQLDANFTTLSNLVPVPCTATGTNALVLTSIAGAATISAYANYMQFTFVAPATNTGATTANVAALGALPIYADTLNGPVALVGGEIVQNCQVTLRYDSTLNGSSGGFHLQGGGGGAINQTLSVTLLLASAASVSSLFKGNSLTLSGPGAFVSLSVSGIGSLATANIASGNVTLTSGSISGLFSGASISLAGGDAVVRLTSTLATFAYTSNMLPFVTELASITLAGAAAGDNIIIGYPITPNASVSFIGYVPATGTINVRAQNISTLSTVAAFTVTLRVTDLGFAT